MFCRHDDTIRERRAYGDAPDVMHLVCPKCGHAVPMIHRDADEHKRVKADGAIKPFTVRKELR